MPKACLSEILWESSDTLTKSQLKGRKVSEYVRFSFGNYPGMYVFRNYDLERRNTKSVQMSESPAFETILNTTKISTQLSSYYTKCTFCKNKS